MSQATVKISQIRENPNALRTVNRTTEEYLGLVDSIRKVGILCPISVRECKDPQTGELFYGLIDGLHRFSGAQDAGLSEIPVIIKSMDDVGVMMAQMMANVHKVETRPVEYSKQLVRILALDPLLTTAQLADQLAKSPTWLNDRLGLTKLTPDIASLVDEGKINLSNAYALSKLPAEEQPNFLDRAMTMTPQQFLPTANARTKELRDAKRQGRDPNAVTEFVPVAHLRKLAELKAEAENKEVARVLTHGIENPVDAFQLGVLWALNLDPQSAQAQRDKDAARKRELEAAKEARKQERAAQKEKEAAAKAAALQGELAAVG